MSIKPLSARNFPTSTTRSDDRAGAAVAVARTEESTRHRSLWFIAFASLVLAGLMATRALGQDENFPFESIPMHPALQDEARASQVRAVTKQYASSGQGNTASVNGYFAYYLPAKITAPDGVKHMSELMEEATKLLGRAEMANRPAVVQTLTRYLFDGMKKVAEGNHLPAARINAILMLARLNSRPADLQTKAPPVPLLQTLPIMLQLYQDTNNVDGVRAAALQGIHRHAMFGLPQISQQDKATIQQLATDLLDSPAPQGRSAEAHAYLQRFAVDILDVMKPQDDKQLATKLVSISTSADKPDLIALYSAARLGSMSADLQGQVAQPEKLLKSWTKRVLLAYQSDLKRIEGLEKKTKAVTQPPKPESFLETRSTTERQSRGARGMGGMGGMEMDMDMGGMSGMGDMDMDMGGMSGMGDMDMDMGGMGGMGSMFGDGGLAAPKHNPQPPEVRVSRRKLNSVLEKVHLGVAGKQTVGVPTQPGGLLAAVAADQKPLVEKWLKDMEPIVADLNDPAHDSRTKWVDKLTEQIELLKGMVGDDEAEANLPDDLQPLDDSNPVDDLGMVGEGA